MMGLAVLGTFFIYLLLSIWLIKCAVKVAKERGISGWKFGFPMALVMYLLVFWDWIPTEIAHDYYCETEAGFWVYKTVDEWKAENPGVLETLVENKGARSEWQGDMNNNTDRYFLNQRFSKVVKRNGKFFLNRWRYEQQIVDVTNNRVLARYVDFSTSTKRRAAGFGASGLKFWLDNKHCENGEYNQGLMYLFKRNVRGLEE